MRDGHANELQSTPCVIRIARRTRHDPMRKLSRHEKMLPRWQAALRKAWLRDHPGKTGDDYEQAGMCGDPHPADYHHWYFDWMEREGEAIMRRLFG
jgi:hypothetical protein